MAASSEGRERERDGCRQWRERETDARVGGIEGEKEREGGEGAGSPEGGKRSQRENSRYLLSPLFPPIILSIYFT